MENVNQLDQAGTANPFYLPEKEDNPLTEQDIKDIKEKIKWVRTCIYQSRELDYKTRIEILEECHDAMRVCEDRASQDRRAYNLFIHALLGAAHALIRTELNNVVLTIAE